RRRRAREASGGRLAGGGRGHAAAWTRNEPRASHRRPEGRTIPDRRAPLPHAGQVGALLRRRTRSAGRARAGRRRGGMIAPVAIALFLCALQDPVRFDAKDVAKILTHSPLGAPPPDPTNAHADDPKAARLGQFLFFDKRLSANGEIACATCHDPARAYADGKTLSEGLGVGKR